MAIWERPALWVHRKRTAGLVMSAPRLACAWDDRLVRGATGVGIEVGDDAEAGRRADDLCGDERPHGVGAMPAKLSENIRPTVTAGLANDVELVNQ